MSLQSLISFTTGLWPKVTVALLFVLGALAMQPAAPAWACTPPPGGLPTYTVADRVAAAEVVFMGTVTAVQGEPYNFQTATIQIEQYFKGQSAVMNVSLGYFGSSSLCLSSVTVGQKAIFYAKGDPATNLQAYYHSQFDAIAPATTEVINQILAALGQASPTPTPFNGNTLTPTPTGSLTPTPTPTRSCRTTRCGEPTPTPTPYATISPNATVVWPSLNQVEPSLVGRGQSVTVSGSGGYLSYADGHYNESARNFNLYLDQTLAGTLGCYVNHCEGQLYIPTEITLGSHVISTEGGSSLTIMVNEGTVSPTPHTSVTPIPTQTPQYGKAKLIVTLPSTQVTVGQAFDVSVNLDTQGGCQYATFDLTLSQTPNQPLEYLSPAKVGPGVSYATPFKLRAVATGMVKLKVTAYGEYNCNGAWTWGYVNGESAELTIQEALPAVHLDLAIPQSGGKFSLSGGNEIEFTAQTFGQAVILRYTPLTSVTIGTISAPLQGVGILYDLSAVDSQGQNLQPRQSYTLTFRYDPNRLPTPPSELGVYFYQNGQWVKEPTSEVNAATHTITARPNHFSQWGIMRQTSAAYKTYLPLIRR